MPTAAAVQDERLSRLLYWAFSVFVAAIPFESVRWGIFSGTFSLSRLAGIILVAAALLLYPRTCFRVLPVALICFGMYYLVAVLRTVISLPWDPEALSMSLARYMTLAQMLALVWIAYNLLQRDQISTAMLWALAGSCTVAAALNLAGFGATAIGTSGRMSFLEENPNTAGGVFAVGALALIELASRNWPRRKWVGMVAAPAVVAILAVLAQTGSRTAALGFAAGALTWAFTSLHRGKRERTWAIAGLLVLAVFGWVAINNPAVRYRWEMTMGEGEAGGIGYRRYIFAESWGMVLDQPLLGWGSFENANELGRRLGTNPRNTHNIYLWILTETGLLGGMPFLLAMYLAFAGAWRARSGPEGRSALVLLVTVAVVGSGTNWISRKFLWLIIAYALAQGARFQRLREATSRWNSNSQAPQTAHRPRDSHLEETLHGESSFSND